MEPKVSIIVPIYNVEKYIGKCIESIMNQTLKDIEVILVNDGSTDKSGKIADKYASIDNRIKVIHQKNLGQGVARNKGIEISNGKFIGFVDSDDWIDLDMYERLYNSICENDADIGVCSRRGYDENLVNGHTKLVEDNEVFDINYNIVDYIDYPVRIYPVGRLDKDSEGLMLITNDGNLMNEILNASNGHEKEYIVTTRQKFNNDFLVKMAKGVPITNRATGKKIITAPCKTEALEDNSFKITIIQGLNRQIRRMCGYFDIDVVSLKRVRIMNIMLGNMRPGELKELSQSELIKLRRMLEKV